MGQIFDHVRRRIQPVLNFITILIIVGLLGLAAGCCLLFHGSIIWTVVYSGAAIWLVIHGLQFRNNPP